MKEVVIDVKELKKVYRLFLPREGIGGHLKDLFKRQYKEITAVDNVSFKVLQGERVGYIGLNGAGKSTTIKLITGIMRPTEGKINICGMDPFINRKKIAQKIAVIFGHKTHLWADLPVCDSFELMKAMYGISDAEYKKKISWLKEKIDLEKIWNQQVRKLSLGQRMLCEIAVCLIYNPQIIFLDEPTIGLDILVKEQIFGLIKDIKDEYGGTVIITSHDLKDIEELCDRIIMIDNGRIIYDGTLEDIYLKYSKKNKIIFLAEGKMDTDLGNIKVKYDCVMEENKLIVNYDSRILPIHVINDVFHNYPVFKDVTMKKEGLEEIVKRIYKERIQNEN